MMQTNMFQSYTEPLEQGEASALVWVFWEIMTENTWIYVYFSENMYTCWMCFEHTCWKGRGATGYYNMTLLALGHMQVSCVQFILVSIYFNFICAQIRFGLSLQGEACFQLISILEGEKKAVDRLIKLTTFLARVMHGPMPKLKQNAWGYSIWTVTFQQMYLSRQTIWSKGLCGI